LKGYLSKADDFKTILTLGVIQLLENLISNKNFFQNYAQEFQKAAPKIEEWRASPSIKKLLDVSPSLSKSLLSFFFLPPSCFFIS